METKIAKKNHTILVEGRQKASLCGVENVISSGSDLINLLTTDGRLAICGKELKIERFNVDDGTLTIAGNIDSMRYATAKAPLLKRLFK